MRRLESALGRLLPYLERPQVALTGGLAVEYHLTLAGHPRIRERIADLDFVARRMDALAAAVTREFLVSHYHVPGPTVPKPLVQLVDPVAGLRIDIFPDSSGHAVPAISATFGATHVPVLRAESILEHKLRTIEKASNASPVDPKHVRDAEALAELCGYTRAFATPHAAKAKMCTDVETTCSRCATSASPDFPLAPKRDIFRILGYV